jgi:uncharacterized protein (DUF885 family)
MSAVFEFADRYVESWAALDPVGATASGYRGREGELTDWSPDGIAARADLNRTTLAELEHIAPDPHALDEDDRRCVLHLRERLESNLVLYDAGELFRELRSGWSPVQRARQWIDVLPKETEDDWARIAAGVDAIPVALDGVRAALAEGLRRGQPAAPRQALVCARQCETWAGDRDSPSFFSTTIASAPADIPAALRKQLETGGDAAAAAYAAVARWLTDEYAPAAEGTPDGVGADRYTALARVHLGIDLDARETYEWGWADLRRIEAELAVEASRIVPGGSVTDAVAHLETDPAGAIDGVEEFRDWLQNLMDRTIVELDGTHFEIPDRIRAVEAMIAPPGGAAAMYYSPPSEDFSRPGRTWYPTLGKTRFPTWGEVSIAYHEGVPGHHFQLATTRLRTDRIDRFRRLAGVSGNAEGWALYAERFMDEIGAFGTPDIRLGYLRAQVLRAVRVVVDIGVHLGLEIPADDRCEGAGGRWTPELGRAFVLDRALFPADFLSSEMDRYLGWPGQAICYKVGERVWLAGRAAAQAARGEEFDLKQWHGAALTLGLIGLDQLRDELRAL